MYMDAAENEQLEALASRLDAVEAAMARLDAGTYGTCASCESDLDPAALANDPLVARCAACADRS
jgi:DnaK suppressor protein